MPTHAAKLNTLPHAPAASRTRAGLRALAVLVILTGASGCTESFYNDLAVAADSFNTGYGAYNYGYTPTPARGSSKAAKTMEIFSAFHDLGTALDGRPRY